MNERTKKILEKLDKNSEAKEAIEDSTFETFNNKLNQIVIQYLPTRDAFLITGPDINIVRNLQWCKDIIDKYDEFVPHNWDEVIKHPERIFYI